MAKFEDSIKELEKIVKSLEDGEPNLDESLKNFEKGISLIKVCQKELESAEEDQGVWTKLFKVFLVDWLVCVAGVLGTGILFVTVFNMAH